jgi:DNA-binding MarR family transcriptional regulator
VANVSDEDIELERLLTQLLRAIAPDFGSAGSQLVGRKATKNEAGARSGDDSAGRSVGDGLEATGSDGPGSGGPGSDGPASGGPGWENPASGGPGWENPASGAIGRGDVDGHAELHPTPDGNGLPELTASEARALIQLISARGIAQGELAALLGLEKSTVSRLAAGLERKGWVHRGRDEDNQRYLRLYLTPAGADLAARVWHAWQSRQARILAALSADERAGLSAGLRGLVRGLAAEGLLEEASAEKH